MHTDTKKYYCAGRYCDRRTQCHRHTSSVQVNNAEFDDYDLLFIRQGLSNPCVYFVDRNIATGVGTN